MASFKEAFRAARNAGKATFTWNGKKYTTELAGESSSSEGTTRPRRRPASAPTPASSPRPKARPSRASSGNGEARGRNASPPARSKSNYATGGDSLLNRALAAVRRGGTSGDVRTAKAASAPSQSSAARYQRGATGPRR